MILEPEDLRGLRGRIAIDIENDPAANFRATPGLLLGLGVWSPDNDVYGFVPTPTERAEQAVKSMVRTWRDGSFLIAHNMKYEMQWLGFGEAELERFRFVDTMVAEHLLNEEYALDLGSCEARRLRRKSKRGILQAIQEQTGYGMKQIAEWPQEAVAEYCTNDCRITYEITAAQYPRLRAEGLQDLMTRSMDYLKLLYRAEQRGMLVDRERAEAMQRKIKIMTTVGHQQLAEVLERDVADLPNLNSPQQLSDLLYKDLGLERPQCPPELLGSPKAKPYQTKTGTGKELLEQLDHPAVDVIQLIKKTAKIKSYLSSYQRLGEETPDGWVIHPRMNQTGTKTGRLSSSDPNIQQVSANVVAKSLDPEGLGLHLRHVFKARPGYAIVGIDYKQMEVVVFALLSREPAMRRLVLRGGDMHSAVAELIYGSYDPVKRKVFKTLNFGLVYGLGEAGMAEMMGVSLEEARRLRSLYLGRFPRIRPWMEDTNRELEARGYVRYWSGRKRRIADRRVFYRGVNAKVQGGSADVLMEAALRVEDYLRREDRGHILALVHDEIVMELRLEELRRTVRSVQRIMRVEDLLGTPFNTDVAIGRVWDG